MKRLAVLISMCLVFACSNYQEKSEPSLIAIEGESSDVKVPTFGAVKFRLRFYQLPCPIDFNRIKRYSGGIL